MNIAFKTPEPSFRSLDAVAEKSAAADRDRRCLHAHGRFRDCRGRIERTDLTSS